MYETGNFVALLWFYLNKITI